MANVSKPQATDGVPTYLGRGDPAARFADYYPAWADSLAGDVTLEGSMLDGDVQGADAIRAVIGGVRELYDRRPLGWFHLVTFDADGRTQHIAAHYRPLSSLQHHAEFAHDVDAFLRAPERQHQPRANDSLERRSS